MSQQGIFSIAPDAQPGTQNGSSNGASPRQGASPFASVSENADQASPFAAVSQDSPFQQVSQSAPENTGGIPQPRPEGHLPAAGITAGVPSSSSPEAGEPAAAKDNAGGPFQMNGFPEQQHQRVMEAAPVAPAAESSPFVNVGDSGPQDYEAAKAGLEPQQDFAAVQPRYPAQASEPQQAAQVQPRQGAPAAPVQAVAAAPAAQAVPTPAPQSFSTGSTGFQQLELRAIFGVDHILTLDEIIQRARTLPGIRNVALVGKDEANALSNFRQALQGMGLGSSHEMKLTSGGGAVDFLTEGETTVAVLHEGAYGPGVQETLIIVAREIGKLA